MKKALTLIAGSLLCASVQAQNYDFYLTNNSNAKEGGPWVQLQCKRDVFLLGASFSGVYKQQPNEQLAYSFSSDEGWFVDDFGGWTCTATRGSYSNGNFQAKTEPSTAQFIIAQAPQSVVHLSVDQAGVLTVNAH